MSTLLCRRSTPLTSTMVNTAKVTFDGFPNDQFTWTVVRNSDAIDLYSAHPER